MKISYISGVRGVPQSVNTKIAGCGCGCKGMGKCGDYPKMGSVLIGATLSPEAKSTCDKKYPDTGTLVKRAANKIARTSCYLAEQTKIDDALKKVGLSIPRQVALGILSLNFDGISSQLNGSSRMTSIINQWKKIGGDEAALRTAIRDGSSRPVKKFGALAKIEDLIKSKVKSKLGIGGIGAVTPEQNKQIKDLLMDDGATSIAYRSSIISAMASVGASMGAAVGSAFAGIGAAPGGAAGVTAGGYIGELIYQATPTLVDKLFPPQSVGAGETPMEDYTPPSESGGGSLVLPLVIGAGLLFFIMKK